MATTVIVGGITPNLKILGDTQRFLFEQPNGILRLENATTPVDSIPVNLDLDFLNIDEKGYRVGFYSDTTNISGMFHLSSLQYQQNQQNSGIVGTKLMTFNENGSDNFLFYKNLNINSNKIINVPNPTNNTDASNKDYVDSTAGIGKSVFYGYVSSTYTSNVGVGDHIKFDSNSFSRGSNIVLDSTSTYTTGTSVASIGRITLLAGYTYKLMGSINNTVSANYNATRWYNADNNSALGLASGASSPISTTDRTPGAGTIAFFTPSVNTRVELRITFNNLFEINGNYDAIGPAYFVIEQI